MQVFCIFSERVGFVNRLRSKTAAVGKKPSKKAAKDPNKPKRPASAFFVFMYEF
jgi:hypothetical protein